MLYRPAMFRMLRTSQTLGALALSFSLALGGCHGRASSHDADHNSATPKSNELPPLTFKAETPNLLLTWIDDAGDFHVVDKPADVPDAGKKNVRVVLTDKEAGTGEQVYVSDLSQPGPDGSFTTHTVSRAAWDELGADKRKSRLEALAPSSATPPSPAASASAAANANAGAIVVIIYGASWCKPCHDAENYLRRKGLNVIKKDIEENEAAAREMKQKLDRAGIPGASIPVIDVMGKLLVGFSATALDRAVEAARASRL